MEITKAKLAEALSYAEENHEVELRETYSGRGMYGGKCIAVTGERDGLSEFETALALLTVMGGLDDEVNGHTAINAMVDLRDMRREDSMGLVRVYYYPGLTVTE